MHNSCMNSATKEDSLLDRYDISLLAALQNFSTDLGGVSVQYRKGEHIGSSFVDLALVGRDGRVSDTPVQTTAAPVAGSVELLSGVRPGDVLTVTTRPGRRWEKAGRRGGALKFSEAITEFRNQDGELVVTSTMVGVETGQAVSQN